MSCEHKNISAEFRYCPYCGMEIKHEPTFDDLLAHRVNIGDEVRFKLNNGTDAAVVVVDKDDDDVRCVMFEGVEDMALYDGRHWWKSNSVNYIDSDAVRRYERFERLLPNRLRDSIKLRNVVQLLDNGSGHSEIVALYPLSAYEVFGEKVPNWALKEDGDKPIPFFVDSAENRKKYLWYTWLRSPDRSNSCTFCGVNSDGSAGNAPADSSYGSAPAFTI